MASADFTINGSACPPEKAVAYGATVNLALLSTAFNTATWSIVGTDRPSTPIPAITPSGSPLGATASFTMVADPGTGLGVALLVECRVNGGRDAAGVEDATLIKRALVGVNNGSGNVPFAVGETAERSATHGYTALLNQALVATGSPGAAGPGLVGAVDAVATSNVSQSGTTAVDGVTLTAGVSRVLCAGQTTTTKNGVKLVQADAWTNPTDFASDAQVAASVGAPLYVKPGGLSGGDSTWYLQSGTTLAGAKVYSRQKTSAIPAPALVATSNIALTGVVTVDGVVSNTVTGDILCVSQTTTSQNGYWTQNASGAWTRPSYYNSDATVAAQLGQAGKAVVGGLTGAGTIWFQSVGTTLAGAKTWTKLNTGSLLQDALGTTLPAQDKTQHKGAAILRDPTNSRNTVDHDRVDIREYGGNPNGVQQTTHTCVAGNPSVALGSALTYAVGQWLLLHQAGAAHGLATPGTPIVVMQGTPGTRTVSVKWVAATDHHGYTAASVATTIANANIDAVSIWQVQTAGAVFTRPAINGTVNQQVTDSSIFTIGRPVTIGGDFYQAYQVTAIPDGTHVTLRYLGGGVQGPFTAPIGTAILTYQYAEAWCLDVPYADKYICYVQFDGSGTYNYYGQIIAHPIPSGVGVLGYYHPTSIRITTSTPPTPPPGIPATAPNAAAPNALRTQITALVGTTATVSPAPESSATGKVAEVCNKIPFEDAASSDITKSVELRLAKGDYYCAGNVDLRHPAHVTGSNAGLQAVGSRLVFRDGCGYGLFNSRCARAWQPGVRYRLGDRVTTDSVVNVAGTWELTTCGNGQTWAISTTAAPSWNTTLGTDTTDANGNVWNYNANGWTAQGSRHDQIGFTSTGKTAPPQRSVQVADLRRDPTMGPMACNPFVAGTTYATGAWVVPSQGKATGKIYKCVTGGVAGTEPASWGRVAGNNTSDGTLNWECVDMLWLQGALIAQFTPSAFSRCQASGTFGAGVAIEGMAGPTGGNPNNSQHSDWDIRGVTGSGIFARGSDANLITLENGEYMPMLLSQTSLSSPYQAQQLFATQDASFYGLAVVDPFSQGYWGFQNYKSTSVQAMGRLVNPYIENPGVATGLVDYNVPAVVGPGGNYGKVRDGATAKRKGGPYQGGVSATASTPDLVIDDAATMQEDYDSVSKSWIRYNGDVTKLVESRSMAQLNFGSYNPGTGKQWLWLMANPAIPAVWIDHYGIHGRGIILPEGVAAQIEGLAAGPTNQTRVRFISTVPTVGTFRLGDRLIWCADNRRLEIRPTVTGGLAPTAWASSHAYTNGDIVGQSSKTFVMVSAFGTSSGSLPGSFASAALGDFIVEGGCCWYCWSGTDPAFRGVPNWNADPVALPDSNAAVDITGGPVRSCSAFTANRAPALALTGAIAGDGMRFENTSAFTCSLPADGGTIVLPAKSWVELVMNAGATAWHQSRYGTYL